MARHPNTPTQSSSVSIPPPPDRIPYQPGARLLAVLAQPPMSHKDTRWQLTERALGRIYWVARAQASKMPLDDSEVVNPSHLLLPDEIMRSQDKLLQKQLEYRMGAAQVAIPIIANQAKLRRFPERTIDGWIIRALLQEDFLKESLASQGLAASDRFPMDFNNFDTRVLRPSLPVIHLAVAVAFAVDASQMAFRSLPEKEAEGVPVGAGGPQISVANILLQPVLARSIIANASGIGRYLPHLKKLRPKHIVHLDWA
jgi:hypothetical protein